MALRSHILAAAALGPWGDERPYAEELWPQIPSNSLVLVDRNFLAVNIRLTYSAERENRHFLTRAKSPSKWRVLKKLAKGDALVKLETSEGHGERELSLSARGQRDASPASTPELLLLPLGSALTRSPW